MMKALCLILTLCAATLPCALAQSTDERESLKSLKGFLVIVEDIPNADARKRGLTQEQVQVQVELRLRKANIRVFATREDWLKVSPNSTLYVNLHVIPAPEPCEPLYLYSLDLEVQQEVYLKGVGKPVFATTWSRGQIGNVGRDNLGSLQESVDRYVDSFINDYLAANGR